MSYATLDELRSQLGGGPTALLQSPAYRATMMHAIPSGVTEEDRAKFIVRNCTGRKVLEFGATGDLHDQIKAVASAYCGVDRDPSPAVMGFDLDDVLEQSLPDPGFVPDLVICGEVLEHLSNPGWFLTRLKRQFPLVGIIITVPNAFSAAGQQWIKKGFENVNKDHVAWYSPKTLSTLLLRAGYETAGLFWYGGAGPTAEGLIVVTE